HRPALPSFPTRRPSDLLNHLIKMREREGRHLAKDLIRRLKAIRQLLKEIRVLHPAVVKKFRAALTERIEKTGLPISKDDERLAKDRKSTRLNSSHVSIS